ncbi:hypothetical protein BGX38DRAFT_719443 [Terfezia claveryi]|nr:hypothetical protein BGX38DRAFT_719443 [Terfezia claveryi]
MSPKADRQERKTNDIRRSQEKEISRQPAILYVGHIDFFFLLLFFFLKKKSCDRPGIMTGSRILPFEGSAYAFGARSGSAIPTLRDNKNYRKITTLHHQISSLYLRSRLLEKKVSTKSSKTSLSQSFLFLSHRSFSSACSQELHLLPNHIHQQYTLTQHACRSPSPPRKTCKLGLPWDPKYFSTPVAFPSQFCNAQN